MQLGVSHDFIMAFYDPGIGTDRVQNVFDAGGYSAIVVEPQRFLYSILETNALKFKSTLEAMKAQLNNGEQPVVERDKLIGDWLWLQGLYYFYAQGKMLGIAEWLNGVTAAKGISAAITSAVPSVTYLFLFLRTLISKVMESMSTEIFSLCFQKQVTKKRQNNSWRRQAIYHQA